ncbi:hypothetical protein pb186bvf_007769 [Paramecium bursaria]
MQNKFPKEELKNRLTQMQYYVTQENGTEPPYQNEYNKVYDKGIYNCIVCGILLFTSETKYNSGCGWPAFYKAADETKIKEIVDKTHGMVRTEVRCQNCDAHLGHKFDDGPVQNGGIRYCINSASINLKKQ